MFKKVRTRPSWINNAGVEDIFSISSCCSEDFADYINYWQHNEYWLFNKPSDMDAIVESEGVDRSELTLFYYEVYERQYDEDQNAWYEVEPEGSFATNVVKPNRATIRGFDVATCSNGTGPECSPLSCNSLGDELAVNRHCLFETFPESKDALEAGKFKNCEPGPFRIFSVYLVENRSGEDVSTQS